MNVRRFLLLCAATMSVNADEPRRDPFLTPADEIRAMIPTEGLTASNVSVQFDWIKLPHLTANQLLRRHLKHSTDGDALYAAVEEMIVQKKAGRMDLNAIMVRTGQRAKVEAIIEKAFSTEFDPPQVSDRTAPGGDNVTEKISPVTPQVFAYRNTGHTVEVEAVTSEDRRIIDLNMAPEWVEQLTEWSWGTGAGEIKQPVFGVVKLTTQMLCGNGEWELAGLLTPPWLPEDAGKPPGCAPLPGDRLFLFVRAITGQKPKENVPCGVQQITALAEWIETDTATASALLAQHPAFGEGTALLREALEPMLADGRATLLESAALPVRGGQRSKSESVTEFPYPLEFDPPQVAGNFQATPKPAPPPLPRAPGTPVTHQAFTVRNLGTTLELEVTVGESGHVIDLNCAAELVFHTGFDSFGQGLSESKRPRFQTMKTTCQLHVLPRVPSLIAAFDAPVTDGKAPPLARPRKVLLFIRAIL